MFEFNQNEKSNIAVQIAESYKIKLSSNIEGIGPVFTGANWSVLSTDEKIIFESGDTKLEMPKNTEKISIELSYEELEKKLKFRVEKDDTTAKEIEIKGLKFNRFDIGKDDKNYFKGYIGNIIIDEGALKIYDVFKKPEEPKEPKEPKEPEVTTQAVTTPAVTTTAGELYPDNDFIKRVEDCNINFRTRR